MEEQAFIRLGQVLVDAELRRDTGTLKDLVTEDFVCVGPRGFVLSNTQWLGRFGCLQI